MANPFFLSSVYLAAFSFLLSFFAERKRVKTCTSLLQGHLTARDFKRGDAPKTVDYKELWSGFLSSSRSR